ncbi:MAG TPA: DUF92 domain-containing protein [bacterium]|nr:DUF92 domain-containing protein [bacterium]
MELPVRIVAGVVLTAGVAAIASRRAALTRSGAWAAAVTGVVLAAAGWRWLALVGTFFITSSILTRLESPGGAGRRSNDRGGRRWRQVLANGGIAAAAAVVSAVTGWPQGFGVAAGAVAAATADTWATEVGRWSRTAPRLITTGRPVAPGVSGGVTTTGTLASVAGAVLIGAVALALDGIPRGGGESISPRLAWAAWIAIAGITGSLFDSMLGATVEGRWRVFDNDTVNVAATAWGAAVMLYAARTPGAAAAAPIASALVSSTCARLRGPLSPRAR